MTELFSIQNRRFNWSLRTNWNWWMRYVRISLLRYLIQNIFLSVFSFPSLVSHILFCFLASEIALVFVFGLFRFGTFVGYWFFSSEMISFYNPILSYSLSGICHCLKHGFVNSTWGTCLVCCICVSAVVLLYFSTEFECVFLDRTEFETICFLKNNLYLIFWHVLWLLLTRSFLFSDLLLHLIWSLECSCCVF